MTRKVRIGAVAYLNTRPLVFGFEQGLGGESVELSYDVPSVLAGRMTRGELDVALLPSIELARIPDLEIVPGLGIVSQGPARSVLLVSRKPPAEARTVALDPDSRTSNALTRILFEQVWRTRPEFRTGPRGLDESLERFDAVVRIGDKALFEPLPAGASAVDLGELWSATAGLPFVYAVWAARPGILDRELYRMFHDSRRRGMQVIDLIAADYTWNGRQYPEISREYLMRHIRFRLGSPEVESLKTFFDAAARLGLIPRTPEIRMGMTRWTICHETAAAQRTIRESTTWGERE